MNAQSLGSTQRSTADKALQKILIWGLGGSVLVHTAAIAGISYLSQPNIDDLDITAIERVELAPEPVPTPSAKPIAPVVKPQVVKVAKVAKPVVTAAQTPKPAPIATIAPVVKITKTAVAVKPLANFVPPVAKQPVARSPQPAAVAPQRAAPPPFPDKLFQPTPQRAAPAPKPVVAKRTPKIESPPTATPKPQPVATNNQTALATTSKFKPTPIADNPAPTPSSDDELLPNQPGNPGKVARAAEERAPVTNNQTSLAAASKSPSNFGNFNSSEPNPTSNHDDFGASPPGNNTRIATSKAPAPVASNATGLASTPRKSNRSTNLDSLGGESSNPNEDLASSAPGNNTRIAGSNSGAKTGQSTDRTTLSSGNRRNSSLASNLNGNGTSGTNTGRDELGGLPGKVATGSSSPLAIQCLRNCEINYPDNIEETEAGKDKILVKVTVDANGAITNAQIAKSSGNQKLDLATIEGVKQMQLTAMGKPLTFKVKVNTLLSN